MQKRHLTSWKSFHDKNIQQTRHSRYLIWFLLILPILTPSTCRQWHSPYIKGSVLQDCPPTQLQTPTASPGWCLGFWPTGSVQFSRSVVSNSLQPYGLQHTRFPCPSPTPRACSNSSPSSWWCHPTISSSFVPFSSCLQSFPASGSFPMSQFFASSGQSIGASASVLPMNTQDLFPVGLTGLISLQSKGLSRVFTTVDKHQFFGAQLSLWSYSHIHT